MKITEKELKKKIKETVGKMEYLQPSMILDEKGVLWRFNKKWLKWVTDDLFKLFKKYEI